MKNRLFRSAIFILMIVASGCSEVRSISNSGYRGEGYSSGSSSQYQGELDELSVLGVNAKEDISEEAIKSALSDSKPISLKRGYPIILIQSGARFPDETMTEKLSKYFQITPLIGIPTKPDGYASGGSVEKKKEEEKEKTPSLNKTLRLAAARAGVKTIIVYWGILESAREKIATKTISWVPVVGSLLPDETQQMRIRIKGAVIDVVSGNWIMITTMSFEDKSISADINRSGSDQRQVSVLKEKAYSEFANELVKRFSL
jgi:hypothetical protein